MSVDSGSLSGHSSFVTLVDLVASTSATTPINSQFPDIRQCSTSSTTGHGSCMSCETSRCGACSPLSLPSSTATANDGGPFDNEDSISLKSWFESGLQSASKFAAKFTFPTTYRDGEPLYDVFLGGSCGNTVWRREIVIPYLKKRSITFYDPQRPVWNEGMIYEEALAKENSKLFLFVLDPGTINATSFLEIAYFAARKAPKLVVVFLGRREWSDKAHPMDLPDRIRTCNLLEAILTRHSVPMLTSINEALEYVDNIIIGEKSWSQAMATPLQRLPYIQVKAKRFARNSMKSCRETWNYIKSSLGTFSTRAGLIAAAQILVIFVLHFYVFTNIPIWFLLIPFIAFDYMAVISTIIYCRFKARKRKGKVGRKVVLPIPPIPRVGPTAVNGTTNLEKWQLKKHSSISSSTNMPFYDSMNIIDSEVRTHYKQHHQTLDLKAGRTKKTKAEKLNLNGCISTPIGYDVFLSCSSSNELDWITQKAVPQLHKSGLSYTSAIMCDKEMRIPLLHTASHILYYIPSYKTFLSGMIEIAYFIGHSDWQVTVCVPREAECLVLLDGSERDQEMIRAVNRRNECYRMAFSYLKDMATRRQCKVFSKVEDAIKFIADQNRRETENKKATLRNLLEKQHLVKEKS